MYDYKILLLILGSYIMTYHQTLSEIILDQKKSVNQTLSFLRKPYLNTYNFKKSLVPGLSVMCKSETTESILSYRH